MPWADLPGPIHGFAWEGFGGEWFEFGKGQVDVLEVLFLDGAGGDLLAVASGEGGGEVFEVERKVQPVVDAERDEDVEVVFGVLVGDDDGLGFEDGVGGNNDGAGDGQLGVLWGLRRTTKARRMPRIRNARRTGTKRLRLSGLGEFEIRHWQ